MGPRLTGSDRPARDVYANLLQDTRGLRREQATARDSWFASLPWDWKRETLFELEMLLKGVGTFGNARNHAGPARQSPDVAHDFRTELVILRGAVARSISLIRQLLGDRDRAHSFNRFLESVIPEDSERSRLVQDQLTQDTPIEALFLLRNAFSNYLEIIDGALKSESIEHRVYYAIHNSLTREIGRNAYFNPLIALEFRSEFDRIQNAELLEALAGVRSEVAHRVSALAFLSIFRGIRYLDLMDQYSADGTAPGLPHIILSVFRSDIRALTKFLTVRAADLIADGFEQELMHVPADEIQKTWADLGKEAGKLLSLRVCLATLADLLNIETNKIFGRDVPSPSLVVDENQSLVTANAELRASLHHAVRSIAIELHPKLEQLTLVPGLEAKISASERLRRDIWMFALVLRAFIDKVNSLPPQTNLWAIQANLGFVQEFLAHFRKIGYQLVRSSDYQRLDPFLTALGALRERDLIEKSGFYSAIEECQRFSTFLEQLFEQISERDELKDRPFDRASAGELLKAYLTPD